MMRTTLNLDRDVIEAARSLAHQEDISLGAAVSRLARRGLKDRGSASSKRRGDAIPAFDVAEDAAQFGTDDVKQALEDE
jgi:hypothetical protein